MDKHPEIKKTFKELNKIIWEYQGHKLQCNLNLNKTRLFAIADHIMQMKLSRKQKQKKVEGPNTNKSLIIIWKEVDGKPAWLFLIISLLLEMVEAKFTFSGKRS